MNMEANAKHPPRLIDLDAKTLMGDDVEADISPDLPRRQWLYAWLLDPNIPGNYQKFLDKWIGLLIVANLFTLVFEHVPAIYEPYKHWFHIFDVFSVTVFVIEYLTRLFLAPEDGEFKKSKMPRLAYVFSPFAIIDFLAVAPFFLQAFIPVDLRALRTLRLLRILKLFRIVIPAIKEYKELNRHRTFRQKIHALVYPSEYGGAMQSIFESFIGLWVLISVLAVVLESVQSISYVINIEFVILDALAVGIFTVEYMMRIYSCVEEPGFKNAISGRFKQASTGATIIDLLAILPFFMEVFLTHVFDLRFLRVFRLARLLKLTRQNDATAILGKVLVREWPVMSASAFIMLLLVVLTASLGYLFEHEAQPDKFENIPTAIYWAVITLASVGYGDISPVTPIGRAMTIVLALIGIGIFAIPAALLSSAFSDQLIKERDALKNELMGMLRDGQLDDKEIEHIRSEAKRLHLTIEEINSILEALIKEQEEEKYKQDNLALHLVAEKPEYAVERYKALMGQIHQLALLTDAASFEEIAKKRDRLTATELAVWNLIQHKNTPAD
jgi:voltage-gated potassium channel Kch